MNEGQVLSAVIAWGVTVVLFLSALAVTYSRRSVSWQTMLSLVVGSMLLSLAGAAAATHAVQDPDGVLPIPLLLVIVVARATAASIFLGMLIMLTNRPRWLVHRARRWLSDQTGRIP